MESKTPMQELIKAIELCRSENSEVYDALDYLHTLSTQLLDQESTLIAEHRLMKQFIEDVKDGLYGHPHIGAEETLKQITL